jgi:hypothetical protein
MSKKSTAHIIYYTKTSHEIIYRDFARNLLLDEHYFYTSCDENYELNSKALLPNFDCFEREVSAFAGITFAIIGK